MTAEKIRTVTSLAELDGYESEAKRRGLLPEEVLAIHEARKRLVPKKKRKRRVEI